MLREGVFNIWDKHSNIFRPKLFIVQRVKAMDKLLAFCAVVLFGIDAQYGDVGPEILRVSVLQSAEIAIHNTKCAPSIHKDAGIGHALPLAHRG